MAPILGIIASSQIASNLTAFDSIATVTVGAGGSSSISFSSIPSTYKHLQIRAISQTNRATYNVDNIRIRINGDTGSNYSYHTLFSDPASPSTSALAEGFANQSYIQSTLATVSSVATNTFGATIIDILDYTNTNKYTTLRALSGGDTNGAASGFAGFISLGSGNWMNTNAVTSITLTMQYGSVFNQHSHFALYGVKG